jgi:hypothetical protein
VSLEDTQDVLSDRERGHTVSVVGDTTESLGGFTSRERLPPRSTSRSSVVGSPVHEVGGVLVGTEEEDLGVGSTADVDNGALDTGALTGQQEVDDRVDVLVEALGVVGVDVGQNGTLGSTLRDILVLEVLGRRQGIVLVEQGSDVAVVVLLASRSDDSDTTSGDVSESDVESTEVGADDKEHAERLLGVLDVGQEGRVESEGEGDLGRLVKVALENVLVEDEQRLEDLESVLVGSVLSDLGVELLVGQGLLRLQSLERQGRGELRSLLGGRVVGHRKVDVEHSDEVRVGLDDLSDRVSSKRLLPEPGLDLVEDLGVVGIVVVKDLLEREVGGTKTVAEVLSKDPSDVGISGLLDGLEVVLVDGREERVVGETVEEGSLPDDLVDRVLDGRSSGVGDRVEVHGDDGDSVGELLDVLSGRVETVKVVQVGEGGEELSSVAHLESNDDSSLSAVLDLVHLDDGTGSSLDLVHDALIDIEGVLRGLFKEDGVRNGSDVGVTLSVLDRARSGEGASGDKVASELLGDGG